MTCGGHKFEAELCGHSWVVGAKGKGGKYTPTTTYHAVIRDNRLPAIKRNAFESVLMRWISLEPIIQNEMSQKEKDKYHILTHIYGI